MPDDPLPYGLYYQEALRGIMRRALAVVAEGGLPDDHYFHITFRTDHPAVEMPHVLRLQYPTEMAIILQHVFHDLEVDGTGFSVTLSFNRVQQRLTVPLEAVTTFQDPPANVVLTFLDPEQMLAVQGLIEAGPESAVEEIAAPAAGEGAVSSDGENGKAGNVIAIDRFRKN
ncbi:MAG: ClpXP protease specificity-enhancing factor SspB [Alphaproteobacteria bacterium]|nr:ClpXP protease specificity-enhancing factor SspB [Alphaproteobacteria bacterium]